MHYFKKLLLFIKIYESKINQSHTKLRIHYFSNLQNFNLVSSSYSLSTIFNDVHHQKNHGKSFSNTLKLEEYQWNLVIWGIRPMTSMDTRTEFYGKSDSMLFHILRGLDVTRVRAEERGLPAVGSLFVSLNKRDAL